MLGHRLCWDYTETIYTYILSTQHTGTVPPGQAAEDAAIAVSGVEAAFVGIMKAFGVFLVQWVLFSFFLAIIVSTVPAQSRYTPSTVDVPAWSMHQHRPKYSQEKHDAQQGRTRESTGWRPSPCPLLRVHDAHGEGRGGRGGSGEGWH